MMKKTLSIFTSLIGLLHICTAGPIERADSMRDLIEKKKFTPAVQMQYIDSICRLYMSYDHEVFLDYSKRGFSLARRQKDYSMMSSFIENYAIYYQSMARYDESEKYLRQALEYALESGDREREGFVYQTMAISYARSRVPDTALEYFQKALDIFEQLGNEHLMRNTLGNIGSLYWSLEDMDHAIPYLERSLALAEKAGDDQSGLTAYYTLGNIYLAKKEYDTALQYMTRAMEIANYKPNRYFQVVSLHGLANIYSVGYGDYGKALELTRESMEIADIVGEPEMQFYCWAQLSNIYREQEKWKECMEAAQEAWQADSVNFNGATNMAANILVSNIRLGNYDEAIDFFWKYNEMKNRFIAKDTRDRMAELEVRYETEKKELRISSLEQEKMLYVWLGVAACTVLLLAVGLLLARHRLTVQKRRSAEHQVRQLEQEKELVATRALLEGEAAERSRLARDLHDGLGGMLSVVKLNLSDMGKYAVVDEPDMDRYGKALDMLDRSIGELRRVAHHMMPESLMRHGMRVSLEDFCRSVPGAEFTYLGDDSRLDGPLEVLIYRCTYELVNNAVKHAGAEHINVQLMTDNGVVSLTVRDDGVGFDPGVLTSGTGLDNIRARVSAFHGRIGIYSSPGEGTEISIEIEPS